MIAICQSGQHHPRQQRKNLYSPTLCPLVPSVTLPPTTGDMESRQEQKHVWERARAARVPLINDKHFHTHLMTLAGSHTDPRFSQSSKNNIRALSQRVLSSSERKRPCPRAHRWYDTYGGGVYYSSWCSARNYSIMSVVARPLRHSGPLSQPGAPQLWYNVLTSNLQHSTSSCPTGASGRASRGTYSVERSVYSRKECGYRYMCYIAV